MGPWDSPPFLWLRSWQVCLVNGSDGPYFQLCGVDGVQQQLSPYSRKAAKVGTDNTFPKGRGWLCANKTLFTKQAASMVSSFYSTAAGTEVLWETHTKEGCVTLSRWQGWEKQKVSNVKPQRRCSMWTLKSAARVGAANWGLLFVLHIQLLTSTAPSGNTPEQEVVGAYYLDGG